VTSEQVQLSSESQRRITSSGPVPIESHLSVGTGSNDGGRRDSNCIIINIVSSSGSQLQWGDRSSSVNLLIKSLNIERLFLILLVVLLSLLLCTVSILFREDVSHANDPLPLVVARTKLLH